MAVAKTVDEYIAGFPPEVAERLQRIRAIIVGEVASASGTAPEERIRYGIAAVMLGGLPGRHSEGDRHSEGGIRPSRSAEVEISAEVAETLARERRPEDQRSARLSRPRA